MQYLLLALAINSIFAIIYAQVSILDFSVVDDMIINNYLSGAYGFSDGHAVYLNILLGKFLAFLYSVLPAINWYGVFLLAMVILSFSLVEAVLLSQFGIKWGLLIVALITATATYSMLEHFTYTMIAYCCAGASGACLFFGFETKHKSLRWLCYALAVVMLLLCSFIRWNVVLTAALIWGAFLLIQLLRRKKSAWILAITVLCGLVGCAGCHAADQAAYQNDEEWREYTRFNEARTDYVDFGMVDYSDHVGVYQRFSWSPNDYQMVNMYVHPDGNKYSAEVLEQIVAERGHRYERTPLAVLYKLVEGFHDHEEQTMSMILLLIAAFTAAMFANRNKLLPLFLLAMPFIINIAFIIMRRPLYRVVYPHYIIAALLMLCIIDVGWIKERLVAGSTASRVLTAFLALVSGFMMFANLVSANYYKINKELSLDHGELANYRQYCAYLQNHPENAYLIPTLKIDNDIFFVPEKNSLANTLVVGSWGRHTTYENAVKRAYGIEHNCDSLLTNDNYYIVDVNQLHLVETYFAENLQLEVAFETVDEVGGYRICRAVVVGGE
ncbi:MAG: hypothetical protein ACOYJB_02090 [Christensenellaceae bacterium]